MRRTLAIALAGMALLLAGCSTAPAPTPAEVVVTRVPTLPSDPSDAAWLKAPEHLARLLLQDLVEPRLLKPSTPVVRVQAMTDGTHIAFRLTWDDPTLDYLPGAARFSDACAVQIPARVEADVPAPQMGEPNRRVEITCWRASWQATVDGRGDTIRDLYPNASIDHYPFDAPSLQKGSPEQKETASRYSPARALGNRMEGPRASAVEDLLAEGPGSLTSAPSTTSKGRGRRGEKGWSVLILRHMPPGLTATTRSQVAFAIWQGSQEEVGARKMRTGWIPLALEAAK